MSLRAARMRGCQIGVFLVLVLLVAVSCGIKGDPVPPQEAEDSADG